MIAAGYDGKVLFVDLSLGSVNEESLPEKLEEIHEREELRWLILPLVERLLQSILF